MDLYIILGLQSGASATEIKRAYRRLSRRYHPGVNPGDHAAEALYRRISDAYETLMDPERRRRYDTGARGIAAAVAPVVEFAGFDFSAPAHGVQAATFSELFADVLQRGSREHAVGPRPGADVHASVSLSFEQAMRGTDRQIVVTRQDLCALCTGSGTVRSAGGRCAACHGAGQVRWARGHMVFTRPCAACESTGRGQSTRCGRCGGYGFVMRSDGVSVSIPSGIEDRARLRVPGRGHASRGGAAAGDLYVTVQVEPHERFRREGMDLHVTIDLGVHEALLGTRIDVPSLDGPVSVRVPPGTQAGRRLRVRERGVPGPAGRGDLLVEVRVVLPEIADEEARGLVRAFGALYGGDIRRA